MNTCAKVVIVWRVHREPSDKRIVTGCSALQRENISFLIFFLPVHYFARRGILTISNKQKCCVQHGELCVS